MSVIPIDLHTAKQAVLSTATTIRRKSSLTSELFVTLLEDNPTRSNDPDISGIAEPLRGTSSSYRIIVAAGVLAPSSPDDAQVSQQTIKNTLLNTLETLYHEDRHVEQFRAISSYSDQRIPGLKNMATEWLATYNNPSFYDQCYIGLSFELDAIATGFERTKAYWDNYLQPYITEQELFDQMVDRCRTHGYPIDQVITESGATSPDHIITALYNSRDLVIEAHKHQQALSRLQKSEDDLFFHNLKNNPKAVPLRELWNDSTLVDSERLALIAGFNYHTKSRYRKVVSILSDNDFNVRDFDVKHCARSCARYARLHPSFDFSAHTAQPNEPETEEVQEPVDTMMPSGPAENIEMSM